MATQNRSLAKQIFDKRDSFNKKPLHQYRLVATLLKLPQFAPLEYAPQ
jgi:hypothetical protein